MKTIYFPLAHSFEQHTMELHKTFAKARPGSQIVLILFESCRLDFDAVLVFHDIVIHRPAGIRLHLHSHVSLTDAEVLIWLAGDTRSLRRDAWIHFREDTLRRTVFMSPEEFIQRMDDCDDPRRYSPGQANYAQIERLVKNLLPPQLLNRRIWAGELAEWNLLSPDPRSATAKPRRKSATARVQATNAMQDKNPAVAKGLPSSNRKKD
jgi:hypothetical protein